MDNNLAYYAGDEEEPQYAEELGPLVLSTYPEGDAAELHIQNDPVNQYQRENIIERHGKVDVRCEHRDIAHGFWSEGDGDPCSLLVFEFQFSPNGVARRIKEAHVVVQFAAMQAGQARSCGGGHVPDRHIQR